MGAGHCWTIPKATGNQKYLLVAIDYFTKWVEAETLANIQDWDMKRFVWRNSPSYPQSNDQAEATNKVIVDGLKKRLEEAMGIWVEIAPRFVDVSHDSKRVHGRDPVFYDVWI